MFSILIPTWNNLDHLKLCIDSIRRHSAWPHQIIVHVNDGSDGSADWVRSQGWRRPSATHNIGICLAVNGFGDAGRTRSDRLSERRHVLLPRLGHAR